VPVVSLYPRQYSVLRHAAVSDERLAERTTLSAVRILLGSLGATIVAVATLPLVGALGKGNQQHGFFYTAVVFGVIATFFLLVSFRNVKENISITQERMTLKRAWVSLRANRPWFVFAINIFLMWGVFLPDRGAGLLFPLLRRQ
jgi:Na+/melibiose symporter-like transporter